MTAKTITSRDGQWTLTMCGDSWVTDVTHNPTGHTIPGRASIATIRKRIADGGMLAELDRAGAVMPVAPVFAKPVKGACEAGVTRCGADALLYPCGWRCGKHSPAAVRVGAEVPAKSKVVEQ